MGGKYSCSSDDNQLITITPCQGESEHHQVKHQYQQVYKERFTCGIANQQHQERQLAQMGEAAPKNSITSSQTHKNNHLNNLRQDQDKSNPSKDDELGELPPFHITKCPTQGLTFHMAQWKLRGPYTQG